MCVCMCVCVTLCVHVSVCVCSTYSIVTCCALINMHRFVPDLDDIVTFEDMVAEDTFSEETKVSAKYMHKNIHDIINFTLRLQLCRLFDSVIGNLSKNFSEGNEYFKVGNSWLTA